MLLLIPGHTWARPDQRYAKDENLTAKCAGPLLDAPICKALAQSPGQTFRLRAGLPMPRYICAPWAKQSSQGAKLCLSSGHETNERLQISTTPIAGRSWSFSASRAAHTDGRQSSVVRGLALTKTTVQQDDVWETVLGRRPSPKACVRFKRRAVLLYPGAGQIRPYPCALSVPCTGLA
jgi:hypothetical protein